MRIHPRRALLAVLVALSAIAACTDQPRDGYTWSRSGPKLGRYEWYVVTQDDLNARCAQPGMTVNACAYRDYARNVCRVYSSFTEVAARSFKPAGTFGGTTLFEHEVWDSPTGPTRGHCAGFDHKEPYRSTTSFGVIHG
jgi:hypothetical protein